MCPYVRQSDLFGRHHVCPPLPPSRGFITVRCSSVTCPLEERTSRTTCRGWRRRWRSPTAWPLSAFHLPASDPGTLLTSSMTSTGYPVYGTADVVVVFGVNVVLIISWLRCVWAETDGVSGPDSEDLLCDSSEYLGGAPPSGPHRPLLAADCE